MNGNGTKDWTLNYGDSSMYSYIYYISSVVAWKTATTCNILPDEAGAWECGKAIPAAVLGTPPTISRI